MLFRVGKPVTGELFYDRTHMRKTIESYIKMHQDFMCKAPRRYGKTSLIKESFISLDIDYLYIDLRKMSRTERFVEAVLNYGFKIAGIAGTVRQMKEGVAKFMRTHRSALKIDLELFEYTVEFFTDEQKSDNERLMEAFDTLEQIARKRDVKVRVVLDEFQDITKYQESGGDMLEMFRSTIQHHEQCSYIFLGSQMTMMTKTFENKRSPFYNFCRKVTLAPFDINELHKELMEVFKKAGVLFESAEDLANMLKRLNGHPANTMMVMQNIERLSEKMDPKLIRAGDIEAAYEEALLEMHDLLEQYLVEIRQYDHLHDVMYRIANGEAQLLDKNSLYQKHAKLEQLGYVEKAGRGKYRIIDGFLEESLKRG